MSHQTTRRTFLGASLGAGLGAALASSTAKGAAGPPARRGLQILFLGGTGFLGPATVEYAKRRGHTVVLFNRGRTNTDLFPELEKLRGDRNTGDLKALEGDRRFDAVIDTSGYVPSHVAATAGMFAERAKHYVFVSSISVYPKFGQEAVDIGEDAEVATVPDDVVAQVKTIQQSLRHYGGFKALCERAAEAAMPGRVTNVRPGLIVGPRDRSDRFTYWPVRAHRGGEILAPGARDAKTQAIDVRDLGEWLVHCIENRVFGVYNATGFEGILTMQEFLHGCKCATSTPCSFTWVDDDFLQEQGVGPWMEMPMWIPASGMSYALNRRAIEKGLKFRPIGDTIRDTLAWAEDEAGRRAMFTRTGIDPEKEQKVLAAWREARKK